jgi:glycosyltransferase involved in cell wall biosynthesis
MQKTSFPVEILIHDDASTDGTADVIKKHAQKYPNLITPIYQEVNQYSRGVRPIFKFVFPQARGKYIALCEGDDYWTDLYKLQKQVDFLEANKKFDFIYTDVDFYYQNSNTFKHSVFKNNFVYRVKDFEDHLLNKGYLAPCTWLFHKKYLPDSSYLYVDGSFAMMLDIFRKGNVAYLDEVTAVYRVNDGSASRPNGIEKQYNYQKGVFQVQKDYIEKYNVDEQLKKQIYFNTYIILLKNALQLNDQLFIDEIKAYYSANFIDISPMVDMCRENLHLENQSAKINQSHAYKIGKLLLKPFSRIRKYLYQNI